MATSNSPGPGQSAEARRKRGAQPGNLNAFKHGLYSRAFSRLEKDLPGEVTDEETCLRLIILHTVESMNNTEMTHAENIVALRTFSLALGRVESLLRSRKLVYEDQTLLDKILKGRKSPPLEENNGIKGL